MMAFVREVISLATLLGQILKVSGSISAKTGIVWAGKGADDMCDAWILEEMGLYVLGRPRYKWGKESIDSLQKIDWSTIGGKIEQKQTD
jgi:hypothetical protein